MACHKSMPQQRHKSMPQEYASILRMACHKSMPQQRTSTACTQHTSTACTQYTSTACLDSLYSAHFSSSCSAYRSTMRTAYPNSFAEQLSRRLPGNCRHRHALCLPPLPQRAACSQHPQRATTLMTEAIPLSACHCAHNRGHPAFSVPPGAACSLCHGAPYATVLLMLHGAPYAPWCSICSMVVLN